MGRGEVHTRILWENLREGDHLEDSGLDGRIILKWIFEKWDGGTWTEEMWLSIWTGGRQNYGMHKVLKIS
jgi:hypothetical protein